MVKYCRPGKANTIAVNPAAFSVVSAGRDGFDSRLVEQKVNKMYDLMGEKCCWLHQSGENKTGGLLNVLNSEMIWTLRSGLAVFHRGHQMSHFCKNGGRKLRIFMAVA